MTDTKTVTYLILFGILFGLTGRLFAVLLQKSKTVYGKRTGKSIQENRLCVDPTGGVSFSDVERTVLRTWNQSDRAGIFRGELYMFDWILKLLFTVLTLSIGFQGGEVTPLFSIGASLGFVLGSLTGLPPIVCAALGYAAVFGSATNTLLAPVLIGMEVFGVENGLAFFAVCLVAFLVNGNRCIYTAQKRSFW